MQSRFEATLADRGVREIRLSQCLQEPVGAVGFRFSMSCFGGLVLIFGGDPRLQSAKLVGICSARCCSKSSSTRHFSLGMIQNQSTVQISLCYVVTSPYTLASWRRLFALHFVLHYVLHAFVHVKGNTGLHPNFIDWSTTLTLWWFSLRLIESNK